MGKSSQDSGSSSEASDSSASCELGKQEFWEKTYAKEIANFEDTGDTGEIWFGEEVMDKSVAFVDALLRQRCGEAAESLSILDVGTGNGVFLVALAKKGFRRLTGSDYSPQAVALARAVLSKEGLLANNGGGNGAGGVSLIVDNILDPAPGQSYDVVTDKGTFDAVGLSSDAATNRQLYKAGVHRVLAPGGLLIVTSCNNTQEELIAEMSGSGAAAGCVFAVVDHVRDYPRFRFGGHEGTKVCTVAFQKQQP